MTLFALVLLGGIVAMDATSFGQLMLSRPLVAGTLAGAIVGMPFEGAVVGSLLEVLSLSILPVGAARYPDPGTGAVAAVGALGLAATPNTAPMLLVALMYGLLWQRLAGATVIGGRRLNERLVEAGEPGRARMDRLIEHRHLTTMLIDVLRGIAVTSVALLLGIVLLRAAEDRWLLPEIVPAIAVSVAAAAVLAGAAPLFANARRGRIYLVLGLLCGSVLLVMR